MIKWFVYVLILIEKIKLNQRLHDAPSDAVILLEDVDAVFVDRHTAEDADGKKRVTFSGLLNAIDGVASQEVNL